MHRLSGEQLFDHFVQRLRTRAAQGVVRSRESVEDLAYVETCTDELTLTTCKVRAILTREISADDGRCSFQLSVSLRDADDHQLPFDHRYGKGLASAVFAPHQRRLTVLPPRQDVPECWHYRLFVNASWEVDGKTRPRIQPGAMTWAGYLKLTS